MLCMRSAVSNMFILEYNTVRMIHLKKQSISMVGGDWLLQAYTSKVQRTRLM